MVLAAGRLVTRVVDVLTGANASKVEDALLDDFALHPLPLRCFEGSNGALVLRLEWKPAAPSLFPSCVIVDGPAPVPLTTGLRVWAVLFERAIDGTRPLILAAGVE